MMFPTARKDRLVVQEVGDEVIVYDKDRRCYHRLNQSSVAIWRQCDGQKSISELAGFLPEEGEQSARESLVWLALDRLQKADLLSEQLTIPQTGAGITRRGALRSIAGGLALMIPVVAGLVVSRPAHADTGCLCIVDQLPSPPDNPDQPPPPNPPVAATPCDDNHVGQKLNTSLPGKCTAVGVSQNECKSSCNFTITWECKKTTIEVPDPGNPRKKVKRIKFEWTETARKDRCRI